MKIRNFVVAIMAAVVALAGWSCDKEPAETPGQKPTIGIMEPEFNAETMELSVMIAPSTDATAWYWKIEPQTRTEDSEYVKVEGAAAQKIKYSAEYGVEYLISAYAENKAGKSDIAEKRFCAMPEDEVAIALGEVTLHEESMHAMITVYPSKATSKWYWGVIDTEDTEATIEWTADDYAG